MCVACNGAPPGRDADGAEVMCLACGGSGRFEVAACPREELSADVFAALTAADLAEIGCLPSAGGWLDQPQSLIEAIRMIRADSARHRIDIEREALRGH